MDQPVHTQLSASTQGDSCVRLIVRLERLYVISYTKTSFWLLSCIHCRLIFQYEWSVNEVCFTTPHSSLVSRRWVNHVVRCISLITQYSTSSLQTHLARDLQSTECTFLISICQLTQQLTFPQCNWWVQNSTEVPPTCWYSTVTKATHIHI